MKYDVKKMHAFHFLPENSLALSPHTEKYTSVISDIPSGEGMIGDNSYLLLWAKNEIEELNDTYGTEEFMDGIFLIGSDGADNAYGIDVSGNFYEVPFIGMSNREAVKIASSFNEFIDTLWNR